MCLLTDNQHLTFRGNSIGTKAMEAYMKLVGEKVGTQSLQSLQTKMHVHEIASSLLYSYIKLQNFAPDQYMYC